MIHELLKHGSRNAIPTTELCSMTGMGERQVRELIERERLDGYIILSGNRGYSLPSENRDIGQLEVGTWCHMRMLTSTTIARAASLAMQLWESGEYKT
jgi:biotin operon repressor